MTPWFAIGLGPLTQPWGLVAAGVAVIVEAKVSSWESYLTLVLFCVIATSSILAMEIYAGFRPQPAQEFLARSRRWIDTHTDQVIIIVSLVLGFWLAGIVGVVSLTEARAAALIGVFISVTTIPAAADTGLSVAYASWSEARGSVLQLLLNVTVLIAIGAVGLRLQRIIWRVRSHAQGQVAGAPGQ